MSECVVRMEMPNGCHDCKLRNMIRNCPIPIFDGQEEKKIWTLEECFQRPPWCPIICQLPEGHGRLVDADELRREMYHEAFETDTNMQKWDSGCWIRYKLFEKIVDNMPTVPYTPRWHRVEEPPKDACDCLVCWTTIHDEETGEVTGHGFWCEMGWYEDGLLGSVGFYCQSRHEETPVRVEPDYWMPIEPPKEDA